MPAAQHVWGGGSSALVDALAFLPPVALPPAFLQVTTNRRKPEDEFWGEEAGRRFVQQQDELVGAKEEVARLRAMMESGKREGRGGMGGGSKGEGHSARGDHARARCHVSRWCTQCARRAAQPVTQ